MSSPNPTWKPGDLITPPFHSMTSFSPSSLPVREVYKLMIGSIVPRPIALVSTVGNSGKGNLAPFSFFNGVSSDPPCVVISISRKKGGEPKDTLRNIEETKQFVINSANEWMIEPLVYSAGAFPYGVDEMEKVGLTPVPSVVVKPPRVAQSSVQFECELFKLVPLGDGPEVQSTLVIGRIVYVHIDSDCYHNGRVDPEKIRVIGRMGGASYTTLGQIFDLEVPEIG